MQAGPGAGGALLMPRRNHPRPRARKRLATPPPPPTIRPNTEQLARRLVRKGLASAEILDHPFEAPRGRRS